VAGGYLGLAVYPAFSDEIEVRQQLHAVANEGWHHKGREELHRQVMEKLSGIGFHWERPDDGGPVRMAPGLGLTDDDVVVTCTDRGQDCSESDGRVEIRVRYQRLMPLPFLTGKNVTLNFSPHADATLNPVAW